MLSGRQNSAPCKISTLGHKPYFSSSRLITRASFADCITSFQTPKGLLVQYVSGCVNTDIPATAGLSWRCFPSCLWGQLAYQLFRTRPVQCCTKFTLYSKLTTPGASAHLACHSAGAGLTGAQSQEELDKQAKALQQYGVPSQEVFDEQARQQLEQKLDSWFAFLFSFSLIAVLVRAPAGQARMLWVHPQLHKLGIAGCAVVVTIMATGAQYCKDRLVSFWHKQCNRARNLDMIPSVCHDLAVIKQDLSEIKERLSHSKR